MVSSTVSFLALVVSILLFALTGGCESHKMEQLKAHAFRLKPGQDLRKGIQQFVSEKKIEAGWISTCVGSLEVYNIRFANQPGGTTEKGYFEIVSLTGTLSINGSHIHISISDSSGRTIGGHLLDSCVVYTTAELVIMEDTSLEFKREKDGTTPWEELQVRKK